MDRDLEMALVGRLRRGDPGAFDAIYDSYRARVFAFVLRMCRRRALAEDLCQEVWLRLARNASKLAADTRLRPWLFTVARNLVASHMRWRALDSEATDSMVRASSAPQVATPEQLAMAGQTGARLERAVGELPPDQREAFLLVAVERMTPSEAAEVLGIQPDNLRQRLSRARARLADAAWPAAERKTV